MTRFARPLAPAALVLSLLLSACSQGSGGSPGPIAHPPGDDLVLRVEFSGGMIRDFFLTGFPSFTMTGPSLHFAHLPSAPGASAAPVRHEARTVLGPPIPTAKDTTQ